MTFTKKLAAGAIAGILALSMTACSTAASTNVNELINQSLASSGSTYTVSSFDSVSSDTVSLIKEAAKTYSNYASYLENTDDLVDDLESEDASPSEIANALSTSKQRNLKTRSNFEQSLASFSARGIGEAYVISTAEVPELDSDEAVAAYVASLLTGDAKVYVSDVISIPELDDAEGTYTGSCSYMRYVYIEY